eukprot:TRINITY_DN32057_c0_g1_i1.p1 TRINITY_DN32057_c0_g1~~TRINITY_DN32057_c0_g1_i1.p1  ORF type:complete len:333 (-),score=37.22 TRINITY_DN32057_c0_g1_i1:35-988(-)
MTSNGSEMYSHTLEGKGSWVGDFGHPASIRISSVSGSQEFIFGVTCHPGPDWEDIIAAGCSEHFRIVGMRSGVSEWADKTKRMEVIHNVSTEMDFKDGWMIFPIEDEIGRTKLPNKQFAPCILTLWPDTVVEFSVSKFQPCSKPNIGDALYEKRLFTDALVKCGEKEIAVHRSVLAASSAVFENMFSCSMREAKDSILEIKGSPPDAVELMIEFIYTHRVECGPHLAALFSLANQYMLPKLAENVGNLMLQSGHSSEAMVEFLMVVRQHATDSNDHARRLWQALVGKLQNDRVSLKSVLEGLVDCNLERPSKIARKA